MAATLTPKQFKDIADVARARWGLNLTEGKAVLVQNRLSKHVLRSNFESVDAYLKHLKNDASEEDMLVFFDLLSTNTTSFFREMNHFHHLEKVVYPRLIRTRPEKKLRIWSAACSSGAEPYTIAMHLHECFPDIGSWDVRILATDLSQSSIDLARAGVYPSKMIDDQPKDIVRKYFEQSGTGESATYRVRPEIRSMVSVQQLNLMDRWPMKGPFDIIFLRNVMIYFDLDIRTRLVSRMREMMTDDGTLFIGSAETLSGMDVGLKTEIPSVYVKGNA